MRWGGSWPSGHSTYIHVRHEHGVAVLFLVALGFSQPRLSISREARVALHEPDHFR